MSQCCNIIAENLQQSLPNIHRNYVSRIIVADRANSTDAAWCTSNGSSGSDDAGGARYVPDFPAWLYCRSSAYGHAASSHGKLVLAQSHFMTVLCFSKDFSRYLDELGKKNVVFLYFDGHAY